LQLGDTVRRNRSGIFLLGRKTPRRANRRGRLSMRIVGDLAGGHDARAEPAQFPCGLHAAFAFN
jgi:hypothetical protein